MKRFLYLMLFMMLAIVSGAKAQDKGAIISAKATDYDFGVIKEAAGKVSHTFTIDNKGTKPLVITRIIAACGCTTPEYSKEPIAPSKSGSVKVTFDPSGRPGPFVKTVAIYSNGSTGSFTIRIKGVVE